MMLPGKTREKLAGQLTAAAERIGSGLELVLGLVVAAVVIAAGALVVSLRALRAAGA
jgi:hypothetical protein